MHRIVCIKNLNYSKINFHLLSHNGSTIYPSCYIKPKQASNGKFYIVSRDEEGEDIVGAIPIEYVKFFEEAVVSEYLNLKFVYHDYLARPTATDIKKHYTEELKRIAETFDTEFGHTEADRLLIDYLAETGNIDMALTFARMEKWYA